MKMINESRHEITYAMYFKSWKVDPYHPWMCHFTIIKHIFQRFKKIQAFAIKTCDTFEILL